MMPLQLFSNKTFSGANLLTFFLYAGLFSGILFLTLNMVQIQRYSQLQAGMTLLPFTILLILISRWSGGLVDRYGPRWFLIAGSGCSRSGVTSPVFCKTNKWPFRILDHLFSGNCSFWPGYVFYGNTTYYNSYGCSCQSLFRHCIWC